MHVLAFAGETVQLFPDGTIFIHIALILLMIWVLNRTFFKPINKVIESREKFKNVAGGEAGSIQAQAAEKESEYNRAMLEARNAGYELIGGEHRKLVRAREKRLSETKAEVQQKSATEKSEIERQTEEVKEAIRAKAPTLADQIAAAILKQ
jgi:F0F1-type ATP synthase membrane subunit b/b'